MTLEERADCIFRACRANGLDGHIKWIEKKTQAYTWAEKIAMRFKGKRDMPVKNGYMFCETLDMCFFYDEYENACVTYAGYARANSTDLAEDKLVNAFVIAKKVLLDMDRLIKGE